MPRSRKRIKRMANQKAQLLGLEQKLLDAMDRKLLNARHQLAISAEKLDTVSPLATLQRGYSITKTAQKIVTQTSDVKTGDTIITRLVDGEIQSIVK